MHETHLVKPIIENISSHALKEKASKVTALKLKVGQLLGVKEESLRETFNLLSKGTLLDGANLEIIFFPGTRIEVISFDVD